MFNRIKKRWTAFVLFAVITVLCALFGVQYVPGNESAGAASVDDNYYFKNISVDITVNRNKTFDITETLTTVFKEDGINTGFIRDIQRESKTTRVIDGEKSSGYRYIAGIDNVLVSLDGGGGGGSRGC